VILPGSRSEASRLEIPSLPTAKAVGYYLTPLRGLTRARAPFDFAQGRSAPHNSSAAFFGVSFYQFFGQDY
jgi:hypothetical protein